jgi:glycine/D-amino acid oxidase-like deaminating enzyme
MLHELYEVTNFRIVGPYRLWLEFDDGATQEIDFEPILHGNLYGPLRDPEVFAQVELDLVSHTLLWPNGADFDPETLRNWPRYCDAWIEAARRLRQRTVTPAL